MNRFLEFYESILKSVGLESRYKYESIFLHTPKKMGQFDPRTTQGLNVFNISCIIMTTKKPARLARFWFFFVVVLE